MAKKDNKVRNYTPLYLFFGTFIFVVVFSNSLNSLSDSIFRTFSNAAFEGPFMGTQVGKNPSSDQSMQNLNGLLTGTPVPQSTSKLLSCLKCAAGGYCESFETDNPDICHFANTLDNKVKCNASCVAKKLNIFSATEVKPCDRTKKSSVNCGGKPPLCNYDYGDWTCLPSGGTPCFYHKSGKASCEPTTNTDFIINNDCPDKQSVRLYPDVTYYKSIDECLNAVKNDQNVKETAYYGCMNNSCELIKTASKDSGVSVPSSTNPLCSNLTCEIKGLAPVPTKQANPAGGGTETKQCSKCDMGQCTADTPSAPKGLTCENLGEYSGSSCGGRVCNETICSDTDKPATPCPGIWDCYKDLGHKEMGWVGWKCRDTTSTVTTGCHFRKGDGTCGSITVEVTAGKTCKDMDPGLSSDCNSLPAGAVSVNDSHGGRPPGQYTQGDTCGRSNQCGTGLVCRADASNTQALTCQPAAIDSSNQTPGTKDQGGECALAGGGCADVCHNCEGGGGTCDGHKDCGGGTCCK